MNKIQGFDGLRGVAAIAVVLTHLHAFKFFEKASFLPMIDGSAGVQLFFVLSGFLITMLLIREHDKFDCISLKFFYIRRFFRIFPLYLLFMFLVTLICIFVYPVANGKGLLFGYTYLYNFIPKAWYSGQLGHTWSLAVEEHFYLLWPFAFSIFYRKSHKTLLNISLWFVVLSFVANILLINNEWFNSNFFINRWSFISGANILLGCFVALILCGKKSNGRIINILKTNASLMVGVFLWSNTIYLNIGCIPPGYYLRGIGFSLIVAWMFLNQKSKLVNFFEIRPLKFCGLISYGIYIYQGFFLSTGPYRAPGQTWPPSPNIGLILLFFVAPLSYFLFEKPLLKIGTKFRQTVEQDTQPDGTNGGALPEKLSAEMS